MKQKIDQILKFLQDQRKYDFTGNRFSMLERRISKRLFSTGSQNFDEYFQYLLKTPQELDKLVDVLTVNVSSFFRDPLSFGHVEIILREMVLTKLEKNDNSLRIWSAGCAYGEEPYTVAIILSEIFQKEKTNPNTYIFATDIDKKALETAQKGVYGHDAVKDIRFGLLQKYFSKKPDSYKIEPEIKEMVRFSHHDLLGKKSYMPPESVFGDFDIVFCRNVLIYFDIAFQDIIFSKLYRSLNSNGLLILGETEVLSEKYKNNFKRVTKYFKIYRRM